MPQPHQSESLLAFLETLAEPAFLLGTDWVVLAANQTLARSLGIPLSDVVGKRMLDLLPPDAVATRAPYVERAFAGERQEFADCRGHRHFLNHLNPMLDGDGNVMAVAVFAIEITETREAEMAARQNLAHYERIITTCREGVWEIDATGTTVFVNQQMADILGYTVEEFIDKSLHEFMDEEGWEASQRNMARRARGIAEQHDFRFKHKDGRDIWTTLSTTPVYDDSGAYAGALALVTDITETRGLEQKMRHTQKLESLGVLAGGIAHDFNNILAGILGNIGLAQTELDSDSPALKFLGDAEDATMRAAELTRQMLAYSGQGNFVVTSIDLNQTIEQVRALLQTVIPKKIAFEMSLGSELPRIRGDATQLRQVIMNLVTNAADAIGEDAGVISIRTSRTVVSEEELSNAYVDSDLDPGECVSVEVRDTGCGMSPSVVSKIFDPFFSTKRSGHGLGLAAALGIVRAHRAGIFIVTKANEGTTFRVLFPAEGIPSGSVKPRSLSPDNKPVVTAGRALVADDEASVLAMTCHLLERMGYTCCGHSDGDSALRALEGAGADYKLVVLDLTMPRLGGGEVLSRLRTRDQQVPVILMSGYSEHGDLADVVQRGPTTFVQKPFSVDSFTSTVRSLVGPEGGS